VQKITGTAKMDKIPQSSDRPMPPHKLQTQALALPTAARPKGLAASLIGIAKTDSPAPIDDEVAAILDERLGQKYL
jgi:hypothetical protein